MLLAARARGVGGAGAALRRVRVGWLGLILLLAGCRPESAPTLTVDGHAVSQEEVALELRSRLWTRGAEWNALDDAAKTTMRRSAVDACIESHLLAAFATRPPHQVVVTPEQAEQAFQEFTAQFEPPDGWRERMTLHGLTEPQLRERLTAELGQTLAIEHWLAAEKKKAAAELDDAAARVWFEQHREEMRIPERVRVAHIFLTAHDAEKPDRSAEMVAIQQKLASGVSSFAQLAAQFSEDGRSKKTGGELGWMSRNRIPADFADAVFALPVGKVAPVFRTKLGWHLAMVHEKKPSRLPEFAEVKDEVLVMLENQWRASAVERLRAELRAKAQIHEHPGFLAGVEPAAF